MAIALEKTRQKIENDDYESNESPLEGEALGSGQFYVERDGKPETVVKTRTEVRKRMVTPTIRKLVVAANNYKFKTLDRKPISKADLIGKLGMGNGKMVVQVFPKQKIPDSIKLQLSKDTIIMEYEPRNR